MKFLRNKTDFINIRSNYSRYEFRVTVYIYKRLHVLNVPSPKLLIRDDLVKHIKGYATWLLLRLHVFCGEEDDVRPFDLELIQQLLLHGEFA